MAAKPWNAFSSSPVDPGRGVHEASPPNEQDGREGLDTAQASKVKMKQHGDDARSGEASQGDGKPADASPNPPRDNLLRTPAADGESAESANVPVEPEFSTFNYWRQPVGDLIDEEN